MKVEVSTEEYNLIYEQKQKSVIAFEEWDVMKGLLLISDGERTQVADVVQSEYLSEGKYKITFNTLNKPENISESLEELVEPSDREKPVSNWKNVMKAYMAQKKPYYIRDKG